MIVKASKYTNKGFFIYFLCRMLIMSSRQNENLEYMLNVFEEPKSKNDLNFGTCLDCGKDRSGIGWCKDCEINALKGNFKNWTSGNVGIDNFIRHTQLNATESVDYLEHIDFDQFDLIKNTNKGGAFSTVYSAIWMEGPRWVWDEDAEQWTRNGPIKVALKRLNNSQNMSEEYLKQVGYNFFIKKY